jgi:hypothetical protein
MRETILKWTSERRDTDRDDNALLEWLGKHADDCAVLYNIDRKGQVQSLIVTIPTWKT